MDLRNALSSSVISCDLPGRNKEEVLNALIDIAMATGKVRDREVALQSVLTREAGTSTGIQNGIALPHGKSDAVDDLVACVGITKEGIEFDALDGERCRIFIMTLSSIHRTGPHVRFFADVSRLLSDKVKRDAILSAQTPDEVLGILTA
ncbi:MAG TPA: PTS sugar transporter subunit IIA [Spirochaetia bacterium]|nr:PTS sugar transporter subunit IIA [Spirochaetia bacterium]